MRKIALLFLASLCFLNIHAQIYVNGKAVPIEARYVHLKMKVQSTIKVNYGQKDFNNKSILTNENGEEESWDTWVGVINYMDTHGYKPVLKGRRLNDFIDTYRSWLLFEKKKDK